MQKILMRLAGLVIPKSSKIPSHAYAKRKKNGVRGAKPLTLSMPNLSRFSNTAVVYFLVDLLMDGEILKDLESTLIYDAMFFLPN